MESFQAEGGHPLCAGNSLLTYQKTDLHTQGLPKCIFGLYAQPQKRRGAPSHKNSLSFQLKDTLLDEGGRYIIITGDLNSKPYTLYAPKSHQLRFIRKVLKKANFMKQGNLLICGDFNLTSDPKNGHHYKQTQRHDISAVITPYRGTVGYVEMPLC